MEKTFGFKRWKKFLLMPVVYKDTPDVLVFYCKNYPEQCIFDEIALLFLTPGRFTLLIILCTSGVSTSIVSRIYTAPVHKRIKGI